MTTLSYTVPQAGTDLNAIADPEIATALNTIKTWANGSIDTNNLSATAGVLRSQLAGGGSNLAVSTVSINTSAVDGHFYNVGAGSTTFTLPSPTLNATVGVFAGTGLITGAAPVTITASSGSIVGVGQNAASMTLGILGAYVILQANGTNWLIVSGEMDTGWMIISLGGNVSASGGYVPAVRVRGAMAEMSGRLQTTAGGVTALGTVPSQAIPVSPVQFDPTPLSSAWVIAASTGAITASAGGSIGTTFSLDGRTYRLS